MSEGIILVVTPARNEAKGLPELHRRLVAALGDVGDWRWLALDDASTDDTWTTLSTLARADQRIGALRFAVRAGSHAAILSGLRMAAGQEDVAAAAVLAADLQDPPELLPAMIGRWRGGSEVVFAARSTRPGVSPGDRLAGLVVHGAVRLVLPRSRYPWAGTDLGVFGRHVLAALAVDPSPAGNVFVRIARLGLPAAIVPVAKEPRRHGRSQWTLAARVRLARAMLAEACGRPPSASPAPAIGGRLGWAASRCCRIST